MTRTYTLFAGFIALLFIAPVVPQAQTIPVGTPILEDYYRQQQLLGRVDSSLSFMVRPLTATALGQGAYLHYPDSSRTDVVWQSADGHGQVQLLPIVWQNRINTSHPYGWDDGPMIPAKGAQTYLSAGFYAQYRWLSVQLRPELVAAQNSEYEGYGGEAGPSRDWYSFTGNRIDMPERFGTGAYTRAYLGQSSVRLTLDPVSLGFSTENLYWGPGMRNSILMGNTAPGFAHVTLNTSKPIQTYIGSFEAQVVGGHLQKSGFPPSLLGDTATHMGYARAKPEGSRYFSGITFNYQPRWVPGLFLGMSRAYVTNQEDMKSGWRSYLPFLEGLSKGVRGADSSSSDRGTARDQVISFFFRWAVPRAQVEFYGEYAKNDHNWDPRDATVQLDHTRAYTVGLRKLVPFRNRFGGHLQLSAEMTQMAVTRTRGIRSAGPWYAHTGVRDGYTHRGQVLGSGIGPAGNVQAVNIAWINEFKQLGLQFERLVHNEDYTVAILQDNRRNWVDASVAAYGSWDWQQFIFNAHVQYIHSYNYQHNFVPPEDRNDYWGFTPQDKNNLHIRLGVMYRF